MSGARSYAIALLAGALLTLAFPEPDVAPIAWIALAPLIAVARGSGGRRGFGLGFVFGLGFFGVLVSWVSLVGWVAWGVLVPLQAAFVGVFGACWGVASRRWRGAMGIAVAAALWVAAEYLRSLVPVGGFTWGQLAQSQHNVPWMLSSASLAGGWGTAALLVVINGSLANAWAVRARLGRVAVRLGAAAALVAAPALLPLNDATGDPIRVAVVQGNVPRSITDTGLRDVAILESHRRLTEELAGDALDLVVWPESAVAIDPERSEFAAEQLAAAARAVDTTLIVGGTSDIDEDRYKVMNFQVAPSGEIVDRYQKTHLVPFGEYVPARDLLDWLPILAQVPRDAVAADEAVVFDAAGGPVATVLSFEADFGSLVRTRIDAGGRLLIVGTNTSTWGESWASAQHVAFSQVRAAETGVWVVHAALSGISALVAPDGTVVDSLPLWTAGSMVRELRFAEDVTPYVRFGDWLPWVSVAIAVVSVVLALRARRPAPVGERRPAPASGDVERDRARGRR